MKKTIFYVDGIQGKERPRASMIGGHAHIYTPKKTKDFEKKIASAFLAAGGEVLQKPIPVRVTVVIFHRVPSGVSKKKFTECLEQNTRPTKKPDIDNICKCIMDGLNGVAYEDDTQVVALIAYKYWSVKDYLEIHVTDVTP